jgi:hypothetical protein
VAEHHDVLIAHGRSRPSLGPALSSRALDGADAPAEQLGPKLDAILAELQKLNAR